MDKAQDRFLRKEAWKFILEQRIAALPVDPFIIIRHNSWQLYTYTEMSLRIKKPVTHMKQEYGNDGFVFWSSAENAFVICYNSELPPPIVRWTLIHEMSHIVLRHISKDRPMLTRVRVEERPLFEEEAQGWARRVICPSIVLHDCGAFEAVDIMRLCGITREAATYRSEHMKVLEARSAYRADPLEVEVERQFMPFILRYRSRNTINEIASEIFIKSSHTAA